MFWFLESVQKVQEVLLSNMLEESKTVLELDRGQRKQVRNLVAALELFVREEGDNPKLAAAVHLAEDIHLVLARLNEYMQGDLRWEGFLGALPKYAVRRMNKGLRKIVVAIARWVREVEEKCAAVAQGNAYLRRVPVHKDPQRFYILPKELVFGQNVVWFHPLNELQMSFQRKRRTKDLIKFDPDEPITARRVTRPGDTADAPGSQIMVVRGHHRLFELFRRYVHGRVAGDALIEVLRG